jgi:DNA-binding transcriptional MerR regulator
LVKLYYRIGEVSQIVGVQPHVLRYWESEFRTIRPQKSSKGQRVYSRKDVEKLLRVKDLLKNQGFTIAGARRQLSRPGVEESKPEDTTAPAAPSVAPSPVTSVGVRPTALASPPRHQAKALRRTLVHLREDIVQMLNELDGYGRPEAVSRK